MKTDDKSVIEKQIVIPTTTLQIAIPLTLFLLALAPRLYYLNAGLFHTDSVIEAIAVENTFKTMSLHYMHDPGYPGQVVLVTAVYAIQRLLGGPISAEFAANFSSALMGALGVVAAYFFAKEYFQSKQAGIFPAIILTVFPVYLSISTYAKDHTAEAFFMLCAAYFIIKARKENSVKYTIIASLCLGYTVSIRVVNFLFYPLYLMLLWEDKFPIKFQMEDGLYKIKSARKIKEVLVELTYAFIPSVLIFLLLYAKMFSQQGLEPLIERSEYAGFLGVFSTVLPMSVQWATISLTKAGWVLAALGLILLSSKNPYKGVTLFAWFAFYFFYGGNLRITTPRYVIPGLVSLVFLMGYLLSEIYSKLNKVVAVIAILVLAGVMFNTIKPLIDYKKDFCGPKEFALKVKEITEPNAVIIIMDESYHIQYYGNRSTISHPIDGDTQKIKEHITKIQELLDSGVPVYMGSTAFSYDVANNLGYDAKTGFVIDGFTGKPYNKIVFDPNSRTIKQPETGVVVPLSGRWMLELFQNFKVQYIGSFENDDWHRNSVLDGRFIEALFKITE